MPQRRTLGLNAVASKTLLRPHSPRSVSDYELLFTTVLIHTELDRVVKPAPFVFTEFYKKGCQEKNFRFDRSAILFSRSSPL
jgi:hypothetical protein